MPLVQVLEQFHTVSCEVGSRGLVVCALTRNAASLAAAHCVRSCTCMNALFLRHICAAFEPCVCLAKARSFSRLTLVAINRLSQRTFALLFFGLVQQTTRWFIWCRWA